MSNGFPLPGILIMPGVPSLISITETVSGLTPTVYLDPFGVTPQSLPATITTHTVLFLAPGTYTVTGTNALSQTVTIALGQVATVGAISRLGALRNDTAANWTTINPTLLQGEVGVEYDTGKFKVGSGSTAWASLSYAGSGAATGGLLAANNLSDVSNTATALSNLGGLKASNNLSDVGNAATALSNIGGVGLNSPAFTGTPTAPTATAGDNSTKLATTSYVDTSKPSRLGGNTATASALPTFNVMDYMNGTTDLAVGYVAAYNAAIAAGGGRVIFPALKQPQLGTSPTYTIQTTQVPNAPTSTGTYPVPPVWVEGQGSQSTWLQCTSNITATNLGSGQGTWAVGLVLTCPGGLKGVTIDGGCLAAIGNLGVATGNANSFGNGAIPISTLSITNLSASSAPNSAQIKGTITGASGTTATFNGSNNCPGVINGMAVSGTGCPAGAFVSSGAGTSTLTLGVASGSFTNEGSEVLTFSNTGSGATCGGFVNGGRITVTDSTGVYAQTFDMASSLSGTGTQTMQITPEWPLHSFGTSSTVYAPVAQGANECLLFMYQTSNNLPCDRFKVEDVVCQNINQQQVTPSTQQYCIDLIETAQSYAVEEYVFQDVVNGPNSNPNQDSFTANFAKRVAVRNVKDRGIFRSANFFTFRELNVDTMTIQDIVPGAGSSGNATGRAVCFGQSNADGYAHLNNVTMTDRNQVGSNAYHGCRAVTSIGTDMPGMDLTVTAILGALSSAGLTGGGYCLAAFAPSALFTVASGSNSSTLTTLVTNGLSVNTIPAQNSGSFIPSSGNIYVAASGGIANFSYTGITAGTPGTFTGLTLVSGTGSWTVATGSAVQSIPTTYKAPLVPTTYLATNSQTFELSNISDQSSGSGTWANVCPGLQQVATSFSPLGVLFNSSISSFTSPNNFGVCNKQAGNPGVGTTSYARFDIGTSYIDLNNNNNVYRQQFNDIRGHMGSGVQIENGGQGNGPTFTIIDGRIGSYYSGSASNGPLTVGPNGAGSNGTVGTIHMRGRFDLGGGPLVTNVNSATTIDVQATGSAVGVPATPVLMASGSITNPDMIQVVGLTKPMALRTGTVFGQAIPTVAVSATAYGPWPFDAYVSQTFTSTGTAGTISLKLNSTTIVQSITTPAATGTTYQIGGMVPAGSTFKYTFTNVTAVAAGLTLTG